jgi:uncharacterized hydrophobic protein (TIGR00271 family)
MDHPIGRLAGRLGLRLDACVQQSELMQTRAAAAIPSLTFFLLLIASAIIATLGLISNSTAVVIGAMIVAPLMDPILSLSCGIALGEKRLIANSILLIAIGVISVVLTSFFVTQLLGTNFVQSEIYSRTTPNLIDLGIAVAAAIAGSYCTVRSRLSSSIAGVAVAVALVPPLCVTGIGLSLGDNAVAMFGRGAVAGLSNRIAEGSFLLFLVNLISISFAAVIVFLLHGYGSIRKGGKSLLLTIALIGLISIPLSSSLTDFRLAHALRAEFEYFKQEKIRHLLEEGNDALEWSYVRILYSNLDVENNKGTFDLVLGVPSSLNKQDLLSPLYASVRDRAMKLGLNYLDLKVNVIPSNVFRYVDESTGSGPIPL